MRRPPIGIACALLVALPLAACTDNSDDDASSGDKGGGSGKVSVVSSADECKLSTTEAPSGTLQFAVKNDGDEATEFYLLGEDGKRIVGEVENIGPGLTRDLVVQATPGKYVTACKPGMTGDGIRADFTVTDSGKDVADSDVQSQLDTATAQYAQFVQGETEQLVEATKQFADAYSSGDDETARQLYASTRQHWERIEPVAESFGDLDPRLDLREADLEEGQEWTGWHAIEKDLWPPAAGAGEPYTALTPEQRKALADQLVADTEELEQRVEELTYTPDQLGNGAKELLDEVATGKITGEEEIWSHTDLWDFQANVDGARAAFESLEPVLDAKDPELAETLDTRFTELQTQLDQYKQGDGFVLYTELTDEQIKQLADSVNALSEPLSQLTAAVVL